MGAVRSGRGVSADRAACCSAVAELASLAVFAIAPRRPVGLTTSQKKGKMRFVEAAALRRALWRDPGVVVWAYGFVVALSIAAQAGLPGYPTYGDGQSMLGSALIIDGAVLIGLIRGSKVAWFFAFLFSVAAQASGCSLGSLTGLPSSCSSAHSVCLPSYSSYRLRWTRVSGIVRPVTAVAAS